MFASKQGSAKGSKKCAQKTSSKSQVFFLLANGFMFPWFILNHPHPKVPYFFINTIIALCVSSATVLLLTYSGLIKQTLREIKEMETTTTRRPYFLEENNGLASISDLEPHGFSSSPSSSTEDNHRVGNHLISRPLYLPRKASLTRLSSFHSPRSGRFFHGIFEEQEPHFLDACYLCKKQLGRNKDIFMYRGDTPFCSEECRAEQIDIDEAKEKNKNLSASVRAMRNKEQSETSPNKTSQKYPFHSGAVAAA